MEKYKNKKNTDQKVKIMMEDRKIIINDKTWLWGVEEWPGRKGGNDI